MNSLIAFVRPASESTATKEEKMPIYEYICENCRHELEAIQKISDPQLSDCPECGKSTLKRKTSVSAFHLKGGGWYKDGYSAPSSNSEKTDDSPSSTTDSSTSGETKGETKAAPAAENKTSSSDSSKNSVPSSKAS